MISEILVFINVTIFLVLSLLHFYWAFGGTWAIEYTLPDKFKDLYLQEENKLKIFISTIVVGLGLLAFSLITAANSIDFTALFPQRWTIVLTRIIGVIFLLRAIGDFNLFGIFKQSSISKFAQKDSQIFVPLCLYLGITSILL